MSKRISRRTFLSNAAAAPVVLGVASNSYPAKAIGANPAPGSWVRWLDDRASNVAQGVTWGTPWPRGKLKSAKEFALRAAGGSLVSLQSWPLAYWPDGSVKWSAHAAAPGQIPGDGPFEVV